MKNFLLWIIRFVHLLATLFVALCAIMALLGFAYPLLDSLNHFQPIWFVSALLSILFTSFLHRSGRTRAFLLAIGATGFIASATIVTPEAIARFLPREPFPVENAQPTFTLLTYNIFAKNDDFESIAEMIAAESPDVIVFQEFFRFHKNRLAPLLEQDYPYSVACHGPKRQNIGLYARIPFTVGPLALCDGDKIKRIARIVAKFEPEGSAPFSIMTTHLDWPVQVSPLRRADNLLAGVAGMTTRQTGQFTNLGAAVKKIDGPLLLAGDFNSTSWSYAIRNFVRWNGLTRHTRSLLTYPKLFGVFGWRATPPILPLDQVMSKGAILVHDLRTAAPAGSDHLPIVTKFSVAPN